MRKNIGITVSVIALSLVAASASYYLFFIKMPTHGGIEFVRFSRGKDDVIIMSKFEITQKQYEMIMNDNPSYFKGNDGNPVESLSQNDMMDFCNKLSIACELIPFYEPGTGRDGIIMHPESDGFRLPMDNEWFYALQGNGNSLYYWGNDVDGDYLWYEQNSGGITHPVGMKKPNSFGLYDMCGNVFEVCMTDNPEGLRTAIAGGSYNTANMMLFSKRTCLLFPANGIKDKSIGFRIVKNVPGCLAEFRGENR